MNYNDEGIITSGMDNVILNNTVNYNHKGIIIEEINSYNNNISRNSLRFNDYGIYLSDCENNSIWFNFLYSNGVNAHENMGNNNHWDNGAVGNYWSDYIGEDSNGDGIGDTSYSISGNTGSQDNLPIWELSEYYPPFLGIISPINYDAFGFDAPNFEIKIWADHPSKYNTWYTIDNGLTNYTFTGLTGIINQTAWNVKEYEPMKLKFYVNDSKGNIGFREIIIWKDFIAPKMTINLPSSYQLCGINAPIFSLSIDEPNIQLILYSINGKPNITANQFHLSGRLDQLEWNSAGNGTVSIKFSVIDKAGNINSSEVLVRKDAFIPKIMIISPIEDDIYGIKPPIFEISIDEDDLNTTWYRIEGFSTKYYFTGRNGIIDQELWNRVRDDLVRITFYAQDRAGNIGIASVWVTKRIPSLIPGYDLYLILGVISLITLIIIRKKIRTFYY